MGYIILGCILLLLLFILLLWIRLSIAYDGENANITVKLLFFKYCISGKKKKTPNKNKFKIKKFRKKTEKTLKKYRKKLEKEKQRAAEGAKKKRSGKNKTPEKSSPNEIINKLVYIFGGFLKRFPKYLRIDCLRLIIGVGGEDAAKAAVNYGVTVQSVQYVVTLLNGVTHFKAEDGGNISVYPDFALGKWSADIKLVFRLRVIHILKLGISVLTRYIKYKLKGKSSVKKSAPKEKTAS